VQRLLLSFAGVKHVVYSGNLQEYEASADMTTKYFWGCWDDGKDS
jgi:hypothetical protein